MIIHSILNLSIVMVILLIIWWKILGVLIILMQIILDWVSYPGKMVVRCLLGGLKMVRMYV